VTEPSRNLFWQACGAVGPLRLCVGNPAGQADVCREFELPFLVAGRSPDADLPLDDPAVSLRHAFLQVVAGRVFCLDLQSRTGVLWKGQPRRSGWLDPGQAVRIGPFAVRLADEGLPGAAAPAADRNPLASFPADQDPLPPASLEILNGTRKNTVWRVSRAVTVVGRSPECQAQVGGPEVSRSHCCLLRTPLGLWLIDLLAREGTTVNGARVRWARLEDGDEVRIGGVLLGVRYHPVSGPAGAAAPLPGSADQAAGAPASAGLGEKEARAEWDRSRGEQQASAAEAERLRAQVAALEQALAEVRAAHDGLARAQQEAGAAREAERQALRGQYEREQQARAREAQERARAEELREAARGQFDQEREALRRQAEALRAEALAARQEGERLEAQRAQAVAEVDLLRARAAALEQTLAEAKATHDGLVRGQQEVGAGWQAERQALRGRCEQEQARAHEAEGQARALRADLEVQRGEAGRLRQEAEAARQESEGLRSQLETLRREYEAAAALREEPAPSHQEAEQRFRGAVARFTQLVEQIQSLQTELGQSQGRGGRPARGLARVWARSPAGGEGHDQAALFRRLEALQTEAAAERERAERAHLERQLAETQHQLQEAAERASRLEAELHEHRERAVLRPPLPLPYPEGGAASG
jgi:pSer/pThr/pTyr-binding forkhead associated (FHA) protein